MSFFYVIEVEMTKQYVASALLRSLSGEKRNMFGGARQLPQLSQLWKQKAPFMAKTLGFLLVQLVISYLIMESLSQNQRFGTWYDQHRIAATISIFLLTLGLILILALIPMSMPVKMLVFTIFSILIGIHLTVLRRRVTPEIIRTAIVGVIAIFVTLFMVGLILTLFGFNLSWMFGILLALLLALIIFGIVLLFLQPSQQTLRIFSGIALFLFAMFVMYDTNQILSRDYSGDFITAAMDYYLDVLNLFVNLVQLLSNE